MIGRSGYIDAGPLAGGRAETLANLHLGASVLSWALLGLAETPQSPPPARWCVFLLNLTVGVALCVRRPVRISGTAADFAVCLPSFLMCGLAFKAASPLHAWPIHAELVFALGSLTAIASLLCLGRCFAIFPAVRGTVTSGPYRFIRHPAYAGEAMMVLGCLLAVPSLLSGLVFAVLLPCLAVRIAAEERLLQGQSAYRAYCRTVPWRLFPGLW